MLLRLKTRSEAMYCKRNSFWKTFSPTIPEQDFFHKKITLIISKQLSCCNFMQKLYKFHKKTPFWAHLGPLLAPKRLSIPSHYVSVTLPTYINLDNLKKKWLLCVTIQCLQWPSFILKMQCLFWAHLGPLLAAKLKTKSFPKKSFVSILNHYAGVILC